MNFYGPKSTEQHTIAGRGIPLTEAVYLAILKASEQLFEEPKYSAALPDWVHKICAKLTETILKNVVGMAPGKNNVV